MMSAQDKAALIAELREEFELYGQLYRESPDESVPMLLALAEEALAGRAKYALLDVNGVPTPFLTVAEIDQLEPPLPIKTWRTLLEQARVAARMNDEE